MRGISLWQPYASLIAWGEKKIETRSWPTPYRGPLAILATKTMAQEAENAYWVSLPLQDAVHRHNSTLMKLPLGAVLAVAELVDCFQFDANYKPGFPEGHFGDFTPGRFGWKLENVRALPTPIAARGAQGLFGMRPEIVEQINAQLAQVA